ncbi:hypothetical protein V5799_027712 [Amblyomma americanum]|uniref:Uncharacterized protein n=1 Tax=Amblyomma americanum TaxID=6943 RepID=A0AAQ4DEY1_AMBAM
MATDSMLTYVNAFMEKVTPLLQQLDSTMSIAVRGVESTTAGQEKYLALTDDDKLITDQTLLNLITYTAGDTGIQRYDAVVLLSATIRNA